METIRDSLGTEIEIREYSRIVSTVPSITETLFDFGVAERVIGVTRYCTQPLDAKEPPRSIIGGTKSLQVNKILDLKPDLIIANKEENEKERILSLINLGLNVYVTYPQTVFDGVTMMENIFKLLKLNDEVIYTKFIQNTKQMIHRIQQKVDESDPKPRIFCPIWKDPWMSINKNTFIHSVIEVCGGINIFRDHIDRYPKVGITEIEQLKPDIILLPDEPYIFSDEHVIELKKKLNIPNVKYELINGSYLSWYGTRMVSGIDKLSKLLIGSD